MDRLMFFQKWVNWFKFLRWISYVIFAECAENNGGFVDEVITLVWRTREVRSIRTAPTNLDARVDKWKVTCDHVIAAALEAAFGSNPNPWAPICTHTQVWFKRRVCKTRNPLMRSLVQIQLGTPNLVLDIHYDSCIMSPWKVYLSHYFWY